MIGRKFFTGVLAVAVLAGGAAYHWRGALSVALVERVMAKRFADKPLQALPDGLHAGLCGAGSPFPDPKRGSPCTLVIAGQRLFVFDTGSTASININRMGFDMGSIEAVFLTHFHSDHIGGLGEVMLNRWGTGPNSSPLPVYGPIGVKAVVEGFMQAYYQDHLYRIAHHGTEVMIPSGFGGTPMTFGTSGPEQRVVLIDEPDLSIEAFAVDHSPVEPAVGYKVRYKDRTLVISGDTRQSPAVEREAKGVDLLIHEALATSLIDPIGKIAAEAGRANLAKIFHDIPDYHTTPEQAAETARAAGVDYLLLTHVVPPLPLPGLEQVFLGDSAQIYAGPIHVGLDGDFVSLPAGTDAITLSNRL
ncbi:MBL fold metallo-hydrolase [Pseudomonas sp. N040]|uniref:MBL fold metallo-hydrolase n=1 Tax=Pseudomonas sp. N040 TaxID=2785325 RepID=UPI0018A24DCC|nr:MBL fold metallo-hydrolase [Pseudomonas sp. N040]MBF7731366.1 MBL fold metallo-hydrolase [Pseudomonas sp. N040]MBW7015009.1 MBL fold metallo-hydrolase [Pseudomonas sp. N040]